MFRPEIAPRGWNSWNRHPCFFYFLISNVTLSLSAFALIFKFMRSRRSFATLSPRPELDLPGVSSPVTNASKKETKRNSLYLSIERLKSKGVFLIGRSIFSDW